MGRLEKALTLRTSARFAGIFFGCVLLPARPQTHRWFKKPEHSVIAQLAVHGRGSHDV